MKRILAVILALVMLLTCAASFSPSGNCRAQSGHDSSSRAAIALTLNRGSLLRSGP